MRLRGKEGPIQPTAWDTEGSNYTVQPRLTILILAAGQYG
jgi:hypothetical protein